ncbi:carbohydrate kinase [Rhizobium sp. KVB221]|uniref:Carbohydrate kinase n=1 Tax=Rhizobium setariae TaxID=2801340 RepID=A0A936YQQ8_9HYPH|nr:FGGY family carbohydrate kinase [Rhizobium setariae]MBL0374968.1 carbohydrate kinase [Rhizobium setariae]
MGQYRNIAVIDIGKTNIKVTLFDLDEGREGEVYTAENSVIDDGLYPHHDVDGIWTFILESLGKLQAATPIDAIAISAHGASATLINGDGELALPMLDYEFHGPDTLAAEYDAIRPPFSETGSPRLTAGLNVGAQIFWQSRTFPAEFAEVTSILPYPQYWAMRLTGVRATEMTSLGAHTDLWNPYARDYSSLVDTMGWRGLMPEMSGAFDTLGTIKSNIAKKTGLSPGTTVFSGLHDSNASLLTHLKSRPAPFSVVSTGTWVICFSVGGRTVVLDEARDTLMNVNAYGDPVPSARFMGGRAFALLKADAKAEITPADRDQVLDGAIMLLPSMPDDSGPYMYRKGGWVGAVDKLTPGGHLFAVSLHLGMMTATSLELIGADGPVIVEGPFARNTTFLETLAVMTGRDIVTGGAGLTGTSAGAACVALGRDTTIVSGARVAELSPDPRIAAYVETWQRAIATP